MGCWLKRFGFFKYNDICRQKGIVTLRDLPHKLTRADIRKVSSFEDISK